MAAVRWAADVYGQWMTGSNWTGGNTPGAGSIVAIDLAGPNPYQITCDSAQVSVQSLTIDSPNANVDMYMTNLTIASTLTVRSGNLNLSGSTLTGGTVKTPGGALNLVGSTFVGVTYDAEISLYGLGATLTVRDGLTVHSPNGVGRGLIDVNIGDLIFSGSQTIDNATIILEGSSPCFGGLGAGMACSGQLTLGANLTLKVSGSPYGAWIGYSAFNCNGPTPLIVNQGSIVVTSGSGTFQSIAFTNAGSITVGAKAALYEPGTALFGYAQTFTNTGRIAIGAHGLLSIGGAATLGGSISGAGDLALIGGAQTLAPAASLTVSTVTLSGGDTVAVSGAAQLGGAVAGTGSLTIGAGASLTLGGAVAAGVTAAFTNPAGTLALGDAAQFAGTIASLSAGDAIDLLGLTATGASVNAGDQLVVVNGATTVATLQLDQAYAGSTFTVGSDGHGGVDVTLAGADLSTHAFATAMAAMGSRTGAAWTAAADRGAAPAQSALLSPHGSIFQTRH